MKQDNEIVYEDDDNEIWIDATISHDGFSITCGKIEGSNRVGTTFTIEELEAILAKLKGILQ